MAPVGVALALGLVLFVVLAQPVGAEPNAGTTITVTSTAPDTGGPDCKLRDAFTARWAADGAGFVGENLGRHRARRPGVWGWEFGP